MYNKLNAYKSIFTAALFAVTMAATSAFAGSQPPPNPNNCGSTGSKACLWICQATSPLDGIDGTCDGNWCTGKPDHPCRTGLAQVVLPITTVPPDPAQGSVVCAAARLWVSGWAAGLSACLVADAATGLLQLDTGCVTDRYHDGLRALYPQCSP